jgi:hypothetical protein
MRQSSRRVYYNIIKRLRCSPKHGVFECEGGNEYRANVISAPIRVGSRVVALANQNEWDKAQRNTIKFLIHNTQLYHTCDINNASMA